MNKFVAEGKRRDRQGVHRARLTDERDQKLRPWGRGAGTGVTHAPSVRPAGGCRSGIFLSKDTAADPRLPRTTSLRRGSEQQAAGISLEWGAEVLREGATYRGDLVSPRKPQVRAAAPAQAQVCMHTLICACTRSYKGFTRCFEKCDTGPKGQELGAADGSQGL